MIRKILGPAWALGLAACAAWLAVKLPQASPESSIFALLPPKEGDAAVRYATAALREQAEKRFLVLALDADPARAARAAEAYAARLKASPAVAEAVCAIPPEGSGHMLDFFAPHRFALLSDADRAALASGDSAAYDMARRGLYLPPGLSGGFSFDRDPLGTYGRWLASRGSAAGGLALRDGHLAAEMEGKTAVAVLGTLAPRGKGGSAASAGAGAGAGTQDSLRSAFAEAAGQAAAAGDGPRVEILRAGFVFHELSAARRAQGEMTSIGCVSAVLLLIVMLAVFRGIRPTLLGFLPVAVGCQVATAALLWLGGGKVHLIAMVFGATIVGVAEDYGMLFIAGLYEEGPWDGAKRMAEVGRSIFLGMLTSVAGYVALFFVPIPGLRQIGIFSIAGLAASWLTVALWYPWLSKGLKPVGPGPRRAAASIARNWPRLRSGRPGTPIALAVLAALSIWGCLRLRTDDDVRLLYAQDPALKSEQDRVSAAVRMPGTGRFFLIKGPDGQAILAAEERLRDSLAAASPEAAGILGVTSFVPSAARQLADAVLLHDALLGGAKGAASAAARLAADLGTPELPRRLADTLAAGAHPLALGDWLADPVSLPFRHLWRDSAAILPLPASLGLGADRLAALARGAAPGAILVDPLRDVTDTLGSLRRHVAWVLGIGAVLVALALIPLLKGRAWAALAPAALGIAAGLGCLGFSGLPLNLAGLLGLALILGMGIDYGIFVQESSRQRASALVAINLGAATNMIAFGMLAFSSTPALKAFGLVLGAGLGAAWLTAPCFAPPSEGPAHAA